MVVLAALFLLSLGQVAQGLAPDLLVYVVLAATVGLLLGIVNALVLTLVLTATSTGSRGSIVAFVGGVSRTCGILALAAGVLLGTVLAPRDVYVLVGGVGLVIAVAAAASVRGHLRETTPVGAHEHVPT